MANKMLIDASHPEETRVVVVRGNRVEEFDFESATRRQLRGNIYLAKVTRVEPSLQACFVDYGGNRHGFLAFNEIHPDYYQIPVADRQALIAEEERAAQAAERERERRERAAAKTAHPDPEISEAAAETTSEETAAEAAAEAQAESEMTSEGAPAPAVEPEVVSPELSAGEPQTEEPASHGEQVETEGVEQVGGDALEEVPERTPRRRRSYKIQEVIKRRQVMLVQVVKEERGTKGAALTTYLSLAGRYSVLMPNTARGGGISRKITSLEDRRRLKELVGDLEVPEGMGVILRTAGAARTKAEIKRDFEYLLRLWETVRELTLKSSAPALVYEEGSLVKRAIRDLYNKDIDEVLVAGDEGYQEAKEFMRMLAPSHAKHVKLFKDTQPIFVRYGVEHQLDAMFSPTVQLKSGGYVVMNPTEAMVSIDVNSGRATREHHIEDTALKTNLEAAEEIARQLRLRDLAGLIVIDFIDMEEKRNNRLVERKLKEALKHDRARIQVGRISHFGLLEMSRQRIRTGVLESSTITCPTCGGTGHVRAVSSVALQLLRSIEDQLVKSASHDLIVRTRPDIALYVLNQKRAHLRALEDRFGVTILLQSDATLSGQQYFAIEKGGPARRQPALTPARMAQDSITVEEEEEGQGEAALPADEPVAAHEPLEGRDGGGRHGRRRRRRGRRGGRERGQQGAPQQPQHAPRESANALQPFGHSEAEPFDPEMVAPHEHQPQHHGERSQHQGGDGSHRRRRRRGRRGGRRNRRDRFERSGQAAGGEQGAYEGEIDTTPAPEPRFESPPPAPAPEAAPAESEPAASRRRSTVREPAPNVSFVESGPITSVTPIAPEPEPAARREEEVDPNRPRRSGWWQKR
jgi:ribonuclease E